MMYNNFNNMLDQPLNKKKWICFVCIQEFITFEDYERHILYSHIENEEFLICPRCKAPVRDVKSHWRVKHKSEKIPKLNQYRVNKWKDWGFKYKKQLNKKRKWKDGWFESQKMGKKIFYRSSWERDVMICLEKCTDIDEYYGDDYFNIPYLLRGKHHKYWPDFTVKISNGKTYVLEIKPEQQTEWEINKAKWAAAQKYCEIREWNFQVWTQKYIKKIKTRASRSDILLKEQVIPTRDECIKQLKTLIEQREIIN